MDVTHQSPEISVVLPAYEEADNLKVLLPALKKVLLRLSPSHEILVIDTPEPRDDSPQVCADAGAAHIPREGGDRYGHAVRTGIAKSRGRFIVLMDADGSHNPEFVPELWNRRNDADLIIASRYVSGGKTENPASLIFLSLMVNVAFRLVLGLPCRDVSNSFRLYRGDDLRALRLSCDNFEIVEEILVLLTHAHRCYRVLEIPTVFEERKAGRTKRRLLAFALSYAAVLWRLRRLRAAAIRNEKP